MGTSSRSSSTLKNPFQTFKSFYTIQPTSRMKYAILILVTACAAAVPRRDGSRRKLVEVMDPFEEDPTPKQERRLAIMEVMQHERIADISVRQMYHAASRLPLAFTEQSRIKHNLYKIHMLDQRIDMVCRDMAYESKRQDLLENKLKSLLRQYHQPLSDIKMQLDRSERALSEEQRRIMWDSYERIKEPVERVKKAGGRL